MDIRVPHVCCIFGHILVPRVVAVASYYMEAFVAYKRVNRGEIVEDLKIYILKPTSSWEQLAKMKEKVLVATLKWIMETTLVVISKGIVGTATITGSKGLKDQP